MRTRWLALLVVLLTASLALAWYALAPAGPDFRGSSVGATDDTRAAAPDNQTPHAAAPDQPHSRTNTADTEARGPVKAPPVKESPTPEPDTPPRQVVEERRAVQSPSNPQDTPPPASSAETPTARPFIRGHARPAGQNLGNTRPLPRRISKAAGVRSPAEVSDQLKQDRRGLYAQYFNLPDGKLPATLPDQPSYTRIDRQVSFPDAESFAGVPVGESFAAVWTGFLVIERADDYWLFWGADNGGRVELSGETVLLQDGMVRYVEVSTVLTLQPGVYPLSIEFAQFNNGVADWKKTAASFMWVPQGESKPVPVPPEMLLLPDWLWSDHAPIITGLSKSAGEIGDEITIEGRNFKDPWTSEQSRFLYDRVVTFAGQRARILSQNDTQIRVKVPIGAQTGDVIVRQTISEILDKDEVQIGQIPSNSAHFKVTTQFGLLAEWHTKAEQSELTFDGLALRTAEITRLESQPGEAEAPEVAGAFGVVWSGSLGISDDTARIVASRTEFTIKSLIAFYSFAACRVTIGGVTELTDPGNKGTHRAIILLEDVQAGLVPLCVEAIADDATAPFWHLELRLVSNDDSEDATFTLGCQYFFPPTKPAAPPVIWSAANAAPDPWKPPLALPVLSRPSVAIGETINVTVQLVSSQLLSPLSFALDGTPMPAEFVESKEVLFAWHVTYSMAVPPGVGEGRLTATQGGSASEPFFIDIANRGLIGYYYDFPQPAGLSAVPELGALECFALRKDRRVNFESTADFDLPFPAETFVIEWYGGLIIETEGDYTFTGRTDDGMRLWIDGNLVIDANKPQAPAENSSAAIHLLPGVYTFRMQYFENNQHEVCVLQWRASTGDGENLAEVIPRDVIPARAFTLETHPPLPPNQATGRRTDGS